MRWIARLFADREEIKDKEKLPTGVDGNLVNQGAVDWARNYSYEGLLPGITNVEREAVQKHVAAFFEEGLTVGQLISRLKEVLDPEMADEVAELITRTEVTRAAVEGERATVREADKLLSKYGIEPMVEVWQTRNDELVCPICGPRHGKKEGDGWEKDDGIRRRYRHYETRKRSPQRRTGRSLA